MTKNSKRGKELDNLGVNLVEARTMQKTIKDKESEFRDNILTIMRDEKIKEFSGKLVTINLSSSVKKEVNEKEFINMFHDLATLLEFIKLGILKVDRTAFDAYAKMHKIEIPKNFIIESDGPIRVLAEAKAQ